MPEAFQINSNLCKRVYELNWAFIVSNSHIPLNFLYINFLTALLLKKMSVSNTLQEEIYLLYWTVWNPIKFKYVYVSGEGISKESGLSFPN